VLVILFLITLYVSLTWLNILYHPCVLGTWICIKRG